jgi:hypothetical protein
VQRLRYVYDEEVIMTVRNFALVFGIIYLAAGVLGFVPGLLRPAPPDAPAVSVTAFHGFLLGLFAVNVLHNLVHVAIGAWGIAASRAAWHARVYARTLAVVYGLLAVMGLFPALYTTFGLIPIHGHDVWLHAATALVAAWFGWATTSERATTRAVLR